MGWKGLVTLNVWNLLAGKQFTGIYGNSTDAQSLVNVWNFENELKTIEFFPIALFLHHLGCDFTTKWCIGSLHVSNRLVNNTNRPPSQKMIMSASHQQIGAPKTQKCQKSV